MYCIEISFFGSLTVKMWGVMSIDQLNVICRSTISKKICPHIQASCRSKALCMFPILY